MSRLAALVQAMRSRYQSRVYSRCMALRTAVLPDWTGRWTWSQRVGTASMTSTMSRVKSRGWEVVKRTRWMPLTSPTAARSSAKVRLPLGSLVAVDVLAEELDFGEAGLGDALGFGEDGG